jgi:hypothetical protein
MSLAHGMHHRVLVIFVILVNLPIHLLKIHMKSKLDG